MRNVLHDDADAAESGRGRDSPEEIELSRSEEIVLVEICQEELNAMAAHAGGLLKVMTVAPEREHFADIIDLAKENDIRLFRSLFPIILFKL